MIGMQTARAQYNAQTMATTASTATGQLEASRGVLESGDIGVFLRRLTGRALYGSAQGSGGPRRGILATRQPRVEIMSGQALRALQERLAEFAAARRRSTPSVSAIRKR